MSNSNPIPTAMSTIGRPDEVLDALLSVRHRLKEKLSQEDSNSPEAAKLRESISGYDQLIEARSVLEDEY